MSNQFFIMLIAIWHIRVKYGSFDIYGKSAPVHQCFF